MIQGNVRLACLAERICLNGIRRSYCKQLDQEGAEEKSLEQPGEFDVYLVIRERLDENLIIVVVHTINNDFGYSIAV